MTTFYRSIMPAVLIAGIVMAAAQAAPTSGSHTASSTSSVDPKALNEANRASASAFSSNYMSAGNAISTPAAHNGYQINGMSLASGERFAAPQNNTQNSAIRNPARGFGLKGFGIGPVPESATHSAPAINGMREQHVETSDDMPEAHFQACVRLRMHTSRSVQSAISLCDGLNHTDHTSLTRSAPPSDQTSQPKKTSQVSSPSRAATTDADDSAIDSMDCDVSRDYRVLFSARCLKTADASLYERINLPQPDNGAVNASGGARLNEKRQRTAASEGGVHCDYMVSSLHGPGMLTHSYPDMTMKSCIARALSDTPHFGRVSIQTTLKGRISEALCIKTKTTQCRQVR